MTQRGLDTIKSNLFREVLGSELVFVNLQISTEDLKKRLGQRHMGNEEAVEMLAVRLAI